MLSPSESALVVAWTCAFAIAAKRLVRSRREHVFNPAAVALLWAPIAFGSGESWWGALGDLSAVWSIVLVVVGVLLVGRLNKFPLVLTFLATYFGLFTAVSVLHPALVAEMFRAPFIAGRAVPGVLHADRSAHLAQPVRRSDLVRAAGGGERMRGAAARRWGRCTC